MGELTDEELNQQSPLDVVVWSGCWSASSLTESRESKSLLELKPDILGLPDS